MRRYLLAVVLRGVPSTVHAMVGATTCCALPGLAGSLVGGGVREGVVVHLAVSAFWTVVLTRLRVRGAVAGAVARLLIAALDLEVVGRRNAQIRAVPRVPQWLDHVAFGVLVAQRS